MTDKHTFAAVLLKCDIRAETEIRDAVEAGMSMESNEKKLCLLPGGVSAHSKGPCNNIALVDAAYCFGAFDFIIIVRGGDVGLLEKFIVQCVRAAPKVIETQTILGVSV